MRKRIVVSLVVLIAVAPYCLYMWGGRRTEEPTFHQPDSEGEPGLVVIGPETTAAPSDIDDSWVEDVVSASQAIKVAEARAYWYFEWLKKGVRNEDGAHRLPQPEVPVYVLGLGPEGLLLVHYKDTVSKGMRLGLLNTEDGHINALSPPGRDYNSTAVFNVSSNVVVYIGQEENKVYKVGLNGKEKVVYSFADGEGSSQFASDPHRERVVFFVHDREDIWLRPPGSLPLGVPPCGGGGAFLWTFSSVASCAVLARFEINSMARIKQGVKRDEFRSSRHGGLRRFVYR